MEIYSYKTVYDEEGGLALKKCESYNVAECELVCSNQERAARLFAENIGLGTAAEEYVYVACFDRAMQLKGLSEISHGGKTDAFVDMKTLFQRILLMDGTGIILVHNHPSGKVSMSGADIELTEQAKKCCELLNIDFLDHIVIGAKKYGSTRYYSYKAGKEDFI